MSLFLTPLKMGNPILLKTSLAIKEEDILSEETQEIIENLLHTIKSIDGRVGLAAPQVGILKRIIVYRVPKKLVNDRYKNIHSSEEEDIPWSVLINPKITYYDNSNCFGWEGCVSIPGILGEIPRSNIIKYEGYDENCRHISRTASGFHSRLIQHEIDHLDGILFPMKMTKMSNFGFEEEIKSNYF